MEKRLRSGQGGFSLVELLVSMVVLGILLSAVLALTSGLLGYTRRSSSVNQSLAELNDALGYVALNVRSAHAVIENGVTFAPDVTCSIGAPNRECISIVVPVVEDNGTFANYRLIGYRWLPMVNWVGNPGLPSPPGSFVLLEYRSELLPLATISWQDDGTVDVSVPPTVPVAGEPSLIASALSRAGGYVPISIVDGVVTLRVRGQGVGREENVLVPSDGPITMTVAPRQ